jgi:predicted nucleic acid-binding Zn ribbon protein
LPLGEEAFFMNARLRARVIAEWRGLREQPFVRETAKPIGEPLGKLMQALGLGDRLREDEVKAAWHGIVGDFLATHSEPVALRDGTLIVRVLQPTLHYELDRVWKPKLLQKLRQRFGSRTVRDVKFRIG